MFGLGSMDPKVENSLMKGRSFSISSVHKRIPSNKDVRAAFKNVDLDDDGLINKEEVMEVFEILTIELNDEFLKMVQGMGEETMAYEEFLQKFQEPLFGVNNPHTSLSLESFGSFDEQRQSIGIMYSKLSDLLTQGEDVLQMTTIPTSDHEDIDSLNDPIIEQLNTTHKEKISNLQEERDHLISSLCWLQKELRIQDMTVEDTVKYVVEVILEKEAELERQREVLHQLINRFREKDLSPPEPKAPPTSQSIKCLYELQEQFKYENILNAILQQSNNNNGTGSKTIETSQIEKAIKTLAKNFDMQLEKCIRSSEQEAEMRKAIAEDNGWLWFQLTQLKKKLETNYSPATQTEDNCTIM